MQNFNAPKKGNKGVVIAFLVFAGIFLIAALVAVHFDKDDAKTTATDSAEILVAPGICTRDRRHLCAMSDDVV